MTIQPNLIALLRDGGTERSKSHANSPAQKIACASCTENRFRCHCFQGPDSRHLLREPPVKTMVEPSKFDPFGEPVTMADAAELGRASRWLSRTGAGVFWALVIVIVAARAVYFEPGVFNGLDRALAFAQSLFAAL
jgi:hypothetical protein